MTRWLPRAAAAAIAAAGAWVLWLGVTTLWMVADLSWSGGPTMSGNMGGRALAWTFGPVGVLFTGAGAVMLGVASTLAGMRAPWRARAVRYPGATPSPERTMTDRRVSFAHDGHEFVAVEQASGNAVGSAAPASYRWAVTMDGAPALEFAGEYPYRDPDVQKRVLEWYDIQKPRR